MFDCFLRGKSAGIVFKNANFQKTETEETTLRSTSTKTAFK